eukprot:TRINITY_DN26150_c0_g1_i1.p1 TRINITY_DN26150_c0_g1~~TRINITY_DN26150_c0_g1_i1.p1  ORF type:complete len:307 (+),score=46.46 TRINITY_DN26150_c0_g1_i1:59-979(+)
MGPATRRMYGSPDEEPLSCFSGCWPQRSTKTARARDLARPMNASHSAYCQPPVATSSARWQDPTAESCTGWRDPTPKSCTGWRDPTLESCSGRQAAFLSARPAALKIGDPLCEDGISSHRRKDESSGRKPRFRGSGIAALSLPETKQETGVVESMDIPSLLMDGAVVVDVRSQEERADGFIKGSVHIPYAEWEALSQGWEGNSASRLLRSLAARSASTPVHLVFHCMYSKERAPRSLSYAQRVLEESSPNSIRLSLLRGGFQKFMTHFWPHHQDLLESVEPQQWIPYLTQGLVWRPDVLQQPVWRS